MRRYAPPALAILALGGWLWPLPAAAAGSFLQACTITPWEQAPLFPSAAPVAKAPEAAADDDDDDGDDDSDDDDDDDDDDDTVRGLLSPGTGTCIAISGTLTAGLQRDTYRVSPLLAATGLAPADVTSFPITASFRVETERRLADGSRVASAFEMSFSTPPEGEGGDGPTITEASISLNAWQFGLADSRFDYWTADDFVLSVRVPSRTVGLIGYERVLTPGFKLSLSLEDTQIDPSRSLPPGAGRRFPDAVARLLYEGDELTVQVAGALREVPVVAGSSRLGRAGLVGLTWERAMLGAPMSLTAQIAGAIDAPTYAGSQLDLRLIRRVLTGDETTRAWSGVLAARREWSETIASNLYLSRYELVMPRPGTADWRVKVDRAGANLVWTPVDGFKAGLEGSLAWQRLGLGGRLVAGALSGRQSTVQLFAERTF